MVLSGWAEEMITREGRVSAREFDRAADDLGNIINLGHVNFRVPDQIMATLFYVEGLGLTRDPYMMSGIDNMWVNVGDSQFHLPTGMATQAPVTRTGLVVPDLEALIARLSKIRPRLAGTGFDFSVGPDHVDVTCPWGNHLRCHAVNESQFGPVRLTLAYAEFAIEQGRGLAIAKFYDAIFQASTKVSVTSHGLVVHVGAGDHQWLIFREEASPPPPCLDHHVQIYLAQFSSPYLALKELGLISEESGPHQYRFDTIIDLETGAPVFQLDHEVRSMRHPMYGRSLINRNPLLGTRSFHAGQENFNWRQS